MLCQCRIFADLAVQKAILNQIPHANALSNHSSTASLLAVHAEEHLAYVNSVDSMNPQELFLLQYMTPMVSLLPHTPRR